MTGEEGFTIGRRTAIKAGAPGLISLSLGTLLLAISQPEDTTP
jgi:hypothetical protein